MKLKGEDTLSKKGFIAIDMDGTAIIQKFDKYAGFGLTTTTRGTVRQRTIELAKLAQDAGYDVYILTKRPEIVEKGLKSITSTKTTAAVIDEMKKQNVNIRGIIRTPIGEKKGNQMEEIMSKYRSTNPNAKGFLIDDQVKQLKDVEDKNIDPENKQLIGIDINNVQDLDLYYENMDKLSPYGSKVAVESTKHFITTLDETKVTKDILSGLKLLNEIHDNLDKITNEDNKKIIANIVNDLYTKLDEPLKAEYTPDIE